MKNKWVRVISAVLFAGLLLGIGWQWQPLLAWHQARKLAQASPGERDLLLPRLTAVEAAAIPALVGWLRTDDENAVANCGWALTELAKQWGASNPHSLVLAQRLAREFAQLPPSGRHQTLVILDTIIQTAGEEPLPAELAQLTSSLLESAARDASVETYRPALMPLATHLLYEVQPASETLLSLCQELAATGCKDSRAECRADAVRLAAAPGVGALDRLLPLLGDPSPAVRELVLMAIGPHEELAATDDLLPWLHDADPKVRHACEQVLKSRGLQGPHLQLARRMTDPHPSVRVQVPAQVPDFPDLDTRVWLERLSRDSAPAVRAAVIRVAGETRDLPLRDRLQEMAASDASPTVRQLAQYYLDSWVRQADQ